MTTPDPRIGALVDILLREADYQRRRWAALTSRGRMRPWPFCLVDPRAALRRVVHGTGWAERRPPGRFTTGEVAEAIGLALIALALEDA